MKSKSKETAFRPPYLFSIDPGLHRAGWAFWRIREGKKKPGELLSFGLITTKDIDVTGWPLRALYMSNRIYNKCNSVLPRPTMQVTMVSEMPMEFGGQKGEVALKGGSVRKLAYMVGFLGGRCAQGGWDWETVTPLKWKGQLPKHITLKRVCRRYKNVPRDTDDNVVDAIGIGHWFLQQKYGAK